MSKPIYNSDGININLDCKVTRKNNPTTWLFDLKNEAVKHFNIKVYGSYNTGAGTSAVVSCYINNEKYKDEVIKYLEDNNCTVESWSDLSEEFVEKWNASVGTSYN